MDFQKFETVVEEIEVVEETEVVGEIGSIDEVPSSACSVGTVVADADAAAVVAASLPFEHWLGELCCWTLRMGPVDVDQMDSACSFHRIHYHILHFAFVSVF